MDKVGQNLGLKQWKNELVELCPVVRSKVAFQANSANQLIGVT